MTTTPIDFLSNGNLRATHRSHQKAQANFTFTDFLRAKEDQNHKKRYFLDYRLVTKIGEGTFSEVWKVQSLKDANYYACKKMKQHVESIEQVNNLREIQAMRRLSLHPNILQLHEVAYDKKNGSIALVCELMDMNVYELIRGRRNPLPDSKIKNFMYQLCKSLDYMHRNGIFHRDVKPENILIKQNLLKLADFGSCRSMFSKHPYTEYISTRWYRAPECLLTDGYYGFKMDIWSAGCVFYEITSLHPLFPGSNEVDQIAKIHDVVGTPKGDILRKFKQTRAMNFDFPPKKGTGIPCLVPHISNDSISLMLAMMEYDPDKRITAKQALQHPYFRDLRMAEKQAANLQRTVRGFEDENNVAQGVMHNLWRIHKGRRRHQKYPQQPARCQVPTYPLELPKLNVSGTTKICTYPNHTVKTVFPTVPVSENGTLPQVQPVQFIGKNSKEDSIESLYSSEQGCVNQEDH
ncbi:MAPK/MAK/MRK overlapping kinase isoform X3 [Callorhinchus milii]|uniref:MAPK/MAK/MRK overlapping kinase isoform X3 n=1 Tax=Callorhinchus milii TaxID=7868 RepID=UPI0004571394|nr:MAPK/MAK/MRK overlapping kinase isoform X3 [Callorhinchus milii]XP_007886540.1 MAPK/MAK/MRK overlapping kinase isoform X3 [Callorhinchus milii]|eukprot:gi/632942677/ref/XP_007886539.1/ PREDICTED: MAPK/MAK/MRK overlapping kinase isoform X3 [Callorhinchus milii]